MPPHLADPMPTPLSPAGHADAAGVPGAGDDLSTLAWVEGELRRSLEQCVKALRRWHKESAERGASDVDAVDPAVLRSARAPLHQAAGALELVGQTAAAEVLRAAEAALQRLAARPSGDAAAAVQTIERAAFAVLDYVARRVAGKAVGALAMFPQYAAVQVLAGADRVHPCDLWSRDWHWQTLEPDPGAAARAPDDAARAEMESLVLALMRQPGPEACTRMGTLCAGLAAGAEGRARTLWQLAAALYEGQAAGLIEPDVHVKRLASRLHALLRAAGRGQPEWPDRLARELLFFCLGARLGGDGRASPRLAAVQRTWPPDDEVLTRYDQPRLGLVDPARVVQARKRAAAAKEAWSAAAGGETTAGPSVAESMALLAESTQRLFPDGDALARALQGAAARVAPGEAPPAALAMEVATSMLYLEAVLDDGELDAPALPDRVRRLAARVQAVARGAAPPPLEPWMEELYRRVSDRQTMGSVVQELRASIAEAEKQLDAFFRDPAQTAALMPVPAALASMRGVLSVLGIDQAAQAVVRMREEVDRLVRDGAGDAAEVDASCQRLAENLGALGFLIDMLAVQPHAAKALFRFDEASGRLQSGVGRGVADAGQDAAPPARRAVEAPTSPAAARAAAADAAAAAAAPEAVRAEAGLHADTGPESAADVAADVAAGVAADVAVSAAHVDGDHSQAAPSSTLLAAGPADEDAEMREVFLEEAREVIEGAVAALTALADMPDDVAELTTVRRGFHTLKGSSRMVGLADFGDVAWACERLYNARLAGVARMDGDLAAFTGEALLRLGEWVDAIAGGRPRPEASLGVAAAADALREGRSVAPLAASAVEPVAVPVPVPVPVVAPPLAPVAPIASAEPPAALPSLSAMVPDLPSAADLDLSAPLGPPPELLDQESLEPQAPSADLPGPTFDIAAAESAAVPSPSAEPADRAVAEPAEAPEAMPLDIDSLGIELDLAALDAEEASAAAAADAAARADALDLGIGLFADLAEPAGGQPADADRLPGPDDEAPTAPWAQPAPASAAMLQELRIDLAPRGDGAPLDAGFDAVAFPSLEVCAEPAADLPADFPLDLPAGIAAETAAETVFDTVSDTVSEAAAETAPEPADELAAEAPIELAPAAIEVGEVSLDDWTDAGGQGDAADLVPQDAAQQAVADTAAAHAVAGAADESGETEQTEETDEQVKVVGDLRIPIPLFGIFLNEADEQSRRLGTELAEWALEPARAVGAPAIAMAHSLAGNSATVGHAELSALARQLEHALLRSHAVGRARGDETTLFVEVADEIRRLLHQFAAGFVKPASSELTRRLHEHERWPMPVHAIDAFMVDAAEGAGADADADADADGAAEAVDAIEALDAADAPVEAGAVPATDSAAVDDDRVGQGEAEGAGDLGNLTDAIDTELFPIFEEEAEELLPQLHARLSDWVRQPADRGAAAAAMRTLHTFKGGARLAGAMRLGEIAHRLESGIERLAAGDAAAAAIERLLVRADAMASDFERLRQRPLAAPPVPLVQAAQPSLLPQAPPTADRRIETALTDDGEAAARAAEGDRVAADGGAAAGDAASAAGTGDPTSVAPVAPAAPAVAGLAARTPPQPEPGAFLDWSRFVDTDEASQAAEPAADATAAAGPFAAAGAATVRVRAALLDRLVGEAGEVSITRARLEADVRTLQASMQDLTENLERLRRQLRDLELQAETQMASRLEAAKAAAESFDPLELDRFTRFQEITRMMAESVADVATVQRSLQRTLQSSEDELAAQARLTRALQDDLLRTRMVEFESLADRLYRVVRLAAGEAGKAVRMDLLGGGIEIDRGVLERMIGPFEHLLRNAVAHGIELAETRRAAGKPDTGSITMTVVQEGNEVAVEVRDDGAGLDLARIRARAVERGLLAPDAAADDETLAAMIFEPGFSTAESVSGLAGRGVGMDVVRAEVQAMGGRIRTRSEPGRGTAFRLLLPLTTAVTQVVMLRYGRSQVALPSTLVEAVRRATPAQIDAAYAGGTWDEGGQALPFYWLGALLQDDGRAQAAARSHLVIVVRSAAQRVAVHVDEVVGQQEVVVKKLGPQLTRLPGLAGVTLLPSGRVATIYNPVALAAVYGDDARRRMGPVAGLADVAVADGDAVPALPAAEAAPPLRSPLVMVVDDSLTVRRVTQRLLQREGYRVVLAKDGLDAIDKLAGERPAVLLSDIEMPRMDGFDLVRNVRADARLAGLPVIMITSRIAPKHRELAAALGVDHYLGKPFAEDELLALVARHAGTDVVV